MNLQEFIQAEKVDAINSIKEDIQGGYTSLEELQEGLLADLNDEIELAMFKFIRENIKFDFIADHTGKYYYSMLGKGEQIEFEDLFEIIRRLYVYHHEDQTFTLKFEGFEQKIDKEYLEDNPSLPLTIIRMVGNDWRLILNDFK